MQPESTLSSFTLYPIFSSDCKTCLESSSYKLICSIAGPYFDRKVCHLQPYFNVSISNSSSKQWQPSTTISLQQQLGIVLDNIIVASKYERMMFDVNVEIVQCNQSQCTAFLFSAMVNLLSYTMLIRGVQLQSVFSSATIAMIKHQFQWELPAQHQNIIADGQSALMTQVVEQKLKKTLLMSYEGVFNYLHFQKMSGAVLQANQDIQNFILQKVDEVYELMHQ